MLSQIGLGSLMFRRTNSKARLWEWLWQCPRGIGTLGATFGIEIIEAVLMQNDDATIFTLHQLRALDIRIALDDFGTEYWSRDYQLSF